MGPTDDTQIQAVMRVVRAALGTHSILGAYLHGSSVLGGLRPTSDLDVLVVIDRPTTEPERRTIVDRLLDISGRRARLGPARPVELTIVVASDVRPWRYPTPVELQYGEWLRDRYEAGFVPAPEPSADFAVIAAMTLLGDRALAGPPPAALLDPVPAGDLRRSILDGMPGLIADLRTDTRNVLLSFARIWWTLEHGTIRSKDEAAAWAVDRLSADGRGAAATGLDRARTMYLDGVDLDDWVPDWPGASAAADELVARIEALAPR